MKVPILILSIILLVILLADFANATIIVNHTAVEQFDDIPDYWLEEAKNLTIHYAHTSHGSQVNTGLTWIESNINSTKYSFARRQATTEGLPSEEDPPALRMYDGNPPETYIMPNDYWDNASVSNVLNRTMNVTDTGNYTISLWSWCGQQSSNSEETVNRYLDNMKWLESQYSNVTFILMTGHLGSQNNEYVYSDAERDVLKINNDLVRNFTYNNSMVLFDFADIEAYVEGNDTMCTTNDYHDYYKGYAVECEWPPGGPGSCAHSEGQNCVQKGKAFWWMMARLAGWNGVIDSNLTVTLNSPSDTSLATNTTIIFNCSATDDNQLQNITLYGNWSGGWHENETKTITGTDNSTTFNKTLPVGSYEWNCLAYDNDSNSDWGDNNYTFTITLDSSPPAYSGEITSPSSGSPYSYSQTYQFNMTWIDSNSSVSLVWIEHNFTSFDNYTVSTKSGNEYYYDVGSLGAGTYVYRWCANDSVGNENCSTQQSYAVNQATLSGSISGSNVTYPTTINVIPSESNSGDSDINYTFWRNTTLVSSAIGSVPSADTSQLTADLYHYVLNSTGGGNYSSNSSIDTLDITVNKSSSTCYLTLNPSSQIIYETQTTATCSCTNSETSPTLWRDNSNVTSENGTSVRLGYGTYNYVCNVTQTENYTSASNSSYCNVTKKDASLQLSPTTQSQTYEDTPLYQYCTDNSTLFNCTLYRNGTQITNNTNPRLGAGVYEYVANISDNENYTNYENTSTLTVNQAATSIILYLNGTAWITDQTFNYLHPTEVNVTINVSSLQFSVVLYINETNYTNPNETSHILGTYNYTGVFTGNENYTGNSTTRFLTIQDNVTPTISTVSMVPSIVQPDSNATVIAKIIDNYAMNYAYLIGYNTSWNKVYNETNLTQSGDDWFLTFNVSNITEGVYYFNITAFDTTGNNITEWVKNITINQTGSNLTFSNSSVSTSGKQTTINSTTLNTTLEITTQEDVTNASVSIAKYSENPAGENLGVTALGKYIEIGTSSDIREKLLWTIIKVYYTDDEVNNSGVDESKLRLYYYNETSEDWSAYNPPDGNVNTSENYAWGNTSHFSVYGLFEATTTTTSTTTTIHDGGGGGGAVTTTTTIEETTTTIREVSEEEVVEEEEEEEIDGKAPPPSEELPEEVEKQLIVSLIIFIIFIGSVAYWKRHEVFNLKKKKKRETKIPPPPGPMIKINQILAQTEKYLGKKVVIEGEITSCQSIPDGRTLYRIRDSTGDIYGISKKAGYKGEGMIEGVLRRKGSRLFIEF